MTTAWPTEIDVVANTPKTYTTEKGAWSGESLSGLPLKSKTLIKLDAAGKTDVKYPFNIVVGKRVIFKMEDRSLSSFLTHPPCVHL